MTLVGSEKRQIRKCFMLISMEISLIYRRLLPGSPGARASSAVAAPGLLGPARVARAPRTSLSAAPAARARARPRAPPGSAAVLGCLSHDGFIGPLAS